MTRGRAGRPAPQPCEALLGREGERALGSLVLGGIWVGGSISSGLDTEWGLQDAEPEFKIKQIHINVNIYIRRKVCLKENRGLGRRYPLTQTCNHFTHPPCPFWIL